MKVYLLEIFIVLSFRINASRQYQFTRWHFIAKGHEVFHTFFQCSQYGKEILEKGNKQGDEAEEKGFNEAFT